MRQCKMITNNYPQLIRRPAVIERSGRSKSSLQLDEKAGVMPPPISIGERAVAYIKQEIDAVLQARVEGKNKEQIKALVADLVHNRKQAFKGLPNG